MKTLSDWNYSLLGFSDFLSSDKPGKAAILRHDVDKLPNNSLKFALIQSELGVRGTYYFRIAKESWDEDVIRKIAELGHEIGYHYEDLSLVAERQKTKVKRQKWADKEHLQQYLATQAIQSFRDNLDRLREIVPVRTACMHGSPMSRWDNRILWKYYNYRDFGIIGEPYFDIDFNKVLYLTDTGRRWNGDTFSIRDQVKTSAFSAFKMRSTSDIIGSIEGGLLPDNIMLTFHPQRWADDNLHWVNELIWQNLKNIGKYLLKGMRN